MNSINWHAHWPLCPYLEMEAGFPNLLFSSVRMVGDSARYQGVSDHPEVIR